MRSPANHSEALADASVARDPQTAAARLPPEARLYALQELARRSGVSKHFFRTWKMEVEASVTRVIFRDAPAKIEFLHPAEPPWPLPASEIPVARALWPDGRSAPGDDLVLPFCAEAQARNPLYRFAGQDRVICTLDLLGSFVLTLSRAEERISKAFDQHGRFPASASLAHRHGFLERPVLDEHGLAFEQVLSRLLPAWRPEPRMPRLKLTHDIDHIGMPFQLRNTLGHTWRRAPRGTLRDLAAAISSAEPAELASVLQLARISASANFRSAFYWKASPQGRYDSGYDPAHRKVQLVLASLRNAGHELGIHPGYETFGDRSKLAAEVACLRQALCAVSPGGRQHYLRWAPATWLDWEACGLCYDSSLGFADAFGFRCGTSFPFRPFSLEQNRELRLLELPLILMDCTPVKYMKLPRVEALCRIEKLVERVKRTGGVFTLLWHNSTLLDRAYDGWYEAILGLLAGMPSCELPEDPQELW